MSNVNPVCCIKLTLPFPPSNNTYYRNFRGRMVMSPKGRQYKSDVHEIIKQSGVATLGNVPIDVVIKLYPPDRRIRDIDNSIKAVFDSIKGHLFDDDSQVWKLTIERVEVIKGGSCELEINLYNKNNIL